MFGDQVIADYGFGRPSICTGMKKKFIVDLDVDTWCAYRVRYSANHDSLNLPVLGLIIIGCVIWWLVLVPVLLFGRSVRYCPGFDSIRWFPLIWSSLRFTIFLILTDLLQMAYGCATVALRISVRASVRIVVFVTTSGASMLLLKLLDGRDV